jgi:DNA mismatch repair ATPase MutS
MRFHGILDKATDRSIIILNEVFSSATLEDALSLAEQLMTRIVCLGAIAVYVTFMDEIASLGPETVSMMSTVQKDDPAERTYKILRQEADGLAYAIHIAEKYGLTYESLSRRLRP